MLRLDIKVVVRLLIFFLFLFQKEWIQWFFLLVRSVSLYVSKEILLSSILLALLVFLLAPYFHLFLASVSSFNNYFIQGVFFNYFHSFFAHLFLSHHLQCSRLFLQDSRYMSLFLSQQHLFTFSCLVL